MCCKGPPTGISVTRWANGAALHPLTKPHRTKTSSFRLMTPFHLLRPRQHHRLAAVFHLKARRSLRRSVRAHGPFPKSPDHTSQRGLQPAESHRNQRHGSRPVTATRASQNRGSDRFYRWLQQLRRAWGFFFFGAPFTWEHRTGGTVGGQRNSPPRCGTSQNSPGASAAPRRTGLPRSYPRILPDGDETLRFHLAARPFHTQTPPPLPPCDDAFPAQARFPLQALGRATAAVPHSRGSDGPGQRRAGAAPRYRPADPPPPPSRSRGDRSAALTRRRRRAARTAAASGRGSGSAMEGAQPPPPQRSRRLRRLDRGAGFRAGGAGGGGTSGTAAAPPWRRLSSKRRACRPWIPRSLLVPLRPGVPARSPPLPQRSPFPPPPPRRAVGGERAPAPCRFRDGAASRG